MTRAVLFLALLSLAACGGGSPSQPKLAFAEGPIYDACRASGRRDASRTTCGCAQAVANTSLSARDQAKAVPFFSDPHLAQETRQSDNPFNEAFWKRYVAYAEQAEQFCSGATRA